MHAYEFSGSGFLKRKKYGGMMYLWLKTIGHPGACACKGRI